jgi:hypothetical protein
MPSSALRAKFTFPDPVNEVSARLVATGVVVMSVAFLTTGWVWLLAALAWGFCARVACGPALSPLALLATQVVTPRLPVPPRLVPAAPKRFAQGIGAVMSALALVAALVGAPTVAVVLIAALTVAASLEAFVGFCLGCKIYGLAVRVGWVAEPSCAACADLSVSHRVR